MKRLDGPDLAHGP